VRRSVMRSNRSEKTSKFGSPAGADVLVISQTYAVHRQIETFLCQRGVLAKVGVRGRAKTTTKTGRLPDAIRVRE